MFVKYAVSEQFHWFIFLRPKIQRKKVETCSLFYIISLLLFIFLMFLIFFITTWSLYLLIIPYIYFRIYYYSQTVPTCWQTFEPTLLVNILANILARFAIGTNMLANIVSQTHMLSRFAMDSNMLANILDFERLF